MWLSDKEKKQFKIGCLFWIGLYVFVYLLLPFIEGDFEEEPIGSHENNRFYTDSFHATDKNCVDFSTASAAQIFFEEAGSGDPHDLDRDDDGYACEWNE